MSHRNTFYYDQASNVTCVRDDDLGLTYHTYDLADRVTSVQNPFEEVTYYEYTLGDQVSKRTLGNGCLTYYEYDVKGRVSTIDHRESDMTQIAELAYEYDKVGNPTKIEREDGSATYYAYNAANQMLTEMTDAGTGIAGQDFERRDGSQHTVTVTCLDQNGNAMAGVNIMLTGFHDSRGMRFGNTDADVNAPAFRLVAD